MHGADDGNIAVLHAVENVTEQVVATRKQGEALAAARTAEDRLRTVFSEAPIGVAVLRGPDHRYESANRSYLDVVGRGDLTGKTVREAFPDLEGQGIFPALDHAYATGEPFLANEMHLRLDRYHDGGVHDGYFNFVYQPLRDPSGAVEGIAVVITDVAAQVMARRDAEERERSTAALNETLVAQQSELEALNIHLQEQATELEQQTEEAQSLSEELEIANVTLRQAAADADASRSRAEDARRHTEESERRFRITANAAPVLIWTAALDKGRDWFNQPWLEYTGRTMAQELGGGWADGLHPDERSRCLESYAHSFDARQPFSMEYRLRRRCWCACATRGAAFLRTSCSRSLSRSCRWSRGSRAASGAPGSGSLSAASSRAGWAATSRPRVRREAARCSRW
ncbi:MAG: PAS domain-containing protein, partial [Gemmatimonadaceae bacterium]|nr:PAS domain-containing protein [Gemmatimonadaceae bacterium]